MYFHSPYPHRLVSTKGQLACLAWLELLETWTLARFLMIPTFWTWWAIQSFKSSEEALETLNVIFLLTVLLHFSLGIPMYFWRMYNNRLLVTIQTYVFNNNQILNCLICLLFWGSLKFWLLFLFLQATTMMSNPHVQSM